MHYRQQMLQLQLQTNSNGPFLNSWTSHYQRASTSTWNSLLNDEGVLRRYLFLMQEHEAGKGVEEYEGKSSGLNGRKEAQETKTINLVDIFMILVFHSPSSGELCIATRPLIVAPSNSLHNNTRRKLWMHACPLYRSYYSPSIIVSGQIHVLHNTIPLKWHAKILSTAMAQLLIMSKSTSSPERPTMYNLIVYLEWGGSCQPAYN